MALLKTAPLSRYALFAAALAMCGLPLYIHLPAYLASEYDIALESLGFLLLLLRLFDFIQDPLIGWFLSKQSNRLGWIVGWSSFLLAVGMVGLFAIPAPIVPMLWIAICLAMAFTGFSLLSILVYADGVERGKLFGHVRVATWREAGSLAGITLACLLPFFFAYALSLDASERGGGYRGFAFFVAVALFLFFAGMRGQWLPSQMTLPSFRDLFQNAELRLFLILAFLNALPVAVTSTLFIFFVEFRLGLPNLAGLFLVLFFVSAAFSTPVWKAMAQRLGSRRALVFGMVLSMVSFGWAFTLTQGDDVWFAFVCMTSGAALGADMMLLPALFSQYQARNSVNPALAFGFWNFSGKASLALAAGVVLPLLSWSGFVVDAPKSTEALDALAVLYAIVPCILKIGALLMLLFVIRPEESSTSLTSDILHRDN